MIINSLSVTDFRVFQGKRTFDLAPRKKWNADRPVVLFGGLNGAGKTSILSAIRLALYGKQALGRSVSASKYEEYLRSSIHKAKDRLLQANLAAVELEFRYTHMGVDNIYSVKRYWFVEGAKLIEKLQITRDGKALDELNDEQKQSFLNELIPIGLSDLFFFDGEKIADLALDESGAVLADSIKKLLGLDIINRLEADLGVVEREIARGDKGEVDAKIAELEGEFAKSTEQARAAIRELERDDDDWEAANTALVAASQEYDSLGGTFAKSRKSEELRLGELLSQRETLQSEMRELFAGTAPLALAPNAMQVVLAQVEKEEAAFHAESSARERERLIGLIGDELKKSLPTADVPSVDAALDKIQKNLAKEDGPVDEVHGIGGRALGRMETLAEDARRSKERLDDLAQQLSELNEEIDKTGLQIARAPDDAMLQASHDALEAAKAQFAAVTARREVLRERARLLIHEASGIARQLDELKAEREAAGKLQNEEKLSANVRSVLSEFAHRAAEEKTKVLSTQFAECFARLARKDDMSITAQIDAESFKVTLLNKDGRTVEKDELSAGEKQIYAIAMLEALAKTSGRRLPIIIDTPLGRLDSKHRDKLVNHYFPTASHQVVILSTDTEVDERFYRDLNKHISHSYKLEYEPTAGHTTATESYFWKNAMKAEAA